MAVHVCRMGSGQGGLEGVWRLGSDDQHKHADAESDNKQLESAQETNTCHGAVPPKAWPAGDHHLVALAIDKSSQKSRRRKRKAKKRKPQKQIRGKGTKTARRAAEKEGLKAKRHKGMR